jgi:hypothetical protein
VLKVVEVCQQRVADSPQSLTAPGGRGVSAESCVLTESWQYSPDIEGVITWSSTYRKFGSVTGVLLGEGGGEGGGKAKAVGTLGVWW